MHEIHRDRAACALNRFYRFASATWRVPDGTDQTCCSPRAGRAEGHGTQLSQGGLPVHRCPSAPVVVVVGSPGRLVAGAVVVGAVVVGAGAFTAGRIVVVATGSTTLATWSGAAEVAVVAGDVVADADGGAEDGEAGTIDTTVVGATGVIAR
ncbi:hypothetical protein FHX81_2597 [Saccharothrix saharensis]|uniref:Uncharacterized protein n=1 Tax=Saccharothrix saharensis TaxID=571190 RepID=A0A543JBQ1_9PSEU|nr:hypothetical protein [Saccharothrix saharensis]TQM80269.1 hypothetical protein FHX81_2597 [Saccharothrix saharensis]